MLGELGLPGLALLLALIFGNLAANHRMLQEVERLPPDKASTARNILNCTSAALIAYATGGAFLSAAYYPHMYVLAAMMVAGRHVVRGLLAEHQHAGDSNAIEVRVAKMPITPGAISPEWAPRAQLYSGFDRQSQ
jgi:hypothetical protein